MAAGLGLLGGILAVLPSSAAPLGGLTIGPEQGTVSSPVMLTTDDGCPGSHPFARPYLLDFETLDEVPLGPMVRASTQPQAGDGFQLSVGTWAEHGVPGTSLARTWDVWIDCVDANGNWPAGGIDYFGSVVITANGSWRGYALDIVPAGLDDVAGSSTQTTSLTTGACPDGDTHASLVATLLQLPASLDAQEGAGAAAFRRLAKQRVDRVESAANQQVVFDPGTRLSELTPAGNGYSVTMPDTWDGLADELGDALPLNGLLALTFECMDQAAYDPSAPFRRAYVALLEFTPSGDGRSAFVALDPFTLGELPGPNPTPSPSPTPSPTATPDVPTPTPTPTPPTPTPPTPTPSPSAPTPTPSPNVSPSPVPGAPSALFSAACRPGAAVPPGFGLKQGTTGDDVLVGTGARDLIRGLGGDDILVGLDGDDILCGGLGNDLLTGGNGNDLVRGEIGNDSAYGGAGADAVDGGGQSDLVSGGLGDDVVVGGTGDDVLHGNAGDDRLFGDGGDDRIYGDTGFDRLFGGPGRDVLVPAGRRV